MKGLNEIEIKNNKLKVTKAAKKGKKARLIMNYTPGRLAKGVEIIV
jgi:hypothetical protein